MAKKEARTYWTEARVERLIMWYDRLRGQKGEYAKIASHFSGKSKNSIYKKLGRQGVLGARWSRKHG